MLSMVAGTVAMGCVYMIPNNIINIMYNYNMHTWLIEYVYYAYMVNNSGCYIKLMYDARK